ncbi:restriction endonuclease subunit S [Fibrobacter sp.]|uniref:restriction endonuclease subunit S n=1 Tax=Fibrobacter sp. TaxID=35828 RepID=UPI003890A76C
MRKMKDSGLEWIGEIPSDWDATRIGYESWIRARLGWKGLKAEEYVDEGFAFLSAFNIVDDKLQWENLNFINQQRYDESPEIKLKKGDILLVKDGAGIGKCARIDSLPIGAATTNGSLAVISTHAKLSYRYLYFYLLSPIFQNYIYRLMNGMGVPHLSQEELRKIQIPFPPIDEQKKIAVFLDEKCGEIDSIRSDVQREIEILNDYKKSVITEAVTKGLNPKVKLKDSGVKWIGRIPEHWETVKIGYCFTFSSGDTLTSESIEDVGDYVVYGANGIRGYYSYSNLNGKHILIGRVGALCGNIHIAHGKVWVTEHALIARKRCQLDENFYGYVFEAMNLGQYSKASAQPVISSETISALKFIEPSLEEQKKIASYLDEKCSEIDATIADKQRQLETLDEYKKSLIFEYVTGKKEVAQ